MILVSLVYGISSLAPGSPVWDPGGFLPSRLIGASWSLSPPSHLGVHQGPSPFTGRRAGIAMAAPSSRSTSRCTRVVNIARGQHYHRIHLSSHHPHDYLGRAFFSRARLPLTWHERTGFKRDVCFLRRCACASVHALTTTHNSICHITHSRMYAFSPGLFFAFGATDFCKPLRTLLFGQDTHTHPHIHTTTPHLSLSLSLSLFLLSVYTLLSTG